MRLITEDRPLRAVISGAGFMGAHWAKALLASPRVDLVGWVDLDVDRARAAAGALGLGELPVAASPAELPGAGSRGGWPGAGSRGGSTGPASPEGADFLVNCTFQTAHLETTLGALRGGLAVLTEKPLASTLEAARQLTEAADEAGLLLMVSQNRRYLPGVVALREAAAELGPLILLTTEFLLSHEPLGHVLAMRDPLLWEMCIHLFDAARAISGADAESVYCEAFSPPGSRFAGRDTAAALFGMTGGLRYSFAGSWAPQGLPTSWNGAWRAAGERGTAVWDGTGPPVLQLAGQAPRTLERGEEPAGFPGIAAALAEFENALRTGSTPQGECHDNLRSVAMVDGAMRSADAGERVPINDHFVGHSRQ